MLENLTFAVAFSNKMNYTVTVGRQGGMNNEKNKRATKVL